MIIDSSNVVLESSHSLVQKHEKSERLTASVKNINPAEKQNHKPACDKVTISEKALKHMEKDLDRTIARLSEQISVAMAQKGKELNHALRHLEKDLAKAVRHMNKNLNKEELDGKGIGKALKDLEKDLEKAAEHLQKNLDSEEIRKVKISRHETAKTGLAERLIHDLTGKKVKIKDLKEHHKDHDNHEDDDKKVKSETERPGVRAWKIAYESQESYYENEQMSFNAGGVVRTADGKEITFSLDLMMSRGFLSETTVNIAAAGVRAGNIVVDFEGPASDLADSEFAVMPDSEGDTGSTTFLSIGGGRLTLDLNNDGQISGDSEIIGASTGNGFAELTIHDEDGNGWIDENDSVYGQLSVSYKDAEGNETLSGLKESNVGAIHLGSVETQFALKDSDNQQVGQIESSGVYLTEDGTAGIVQQVSVTV